MDRTAEPPRRSRLLRGARSRPRPPPRPPRTPTRPEYVARLEQICKPGSEATQRAVQGIRADVRSRTPRARRDQVRQGEADLRPHRRARSPPFPAPRPTAPPSRAGSPPSAARRPISAGPPPPSAPKTSPRFQRVSAEFIHQGNRPTTSSSPSASTTAPSSPRGSSEPAARTQIRGGSLRRHCSSLLASTSGSAMPSAAAAPASSSPSTAPSRRLASPAIARSRSPSPLPEPSTAPTPRRRPCASLELAFGARGGLSTAGLPRCKGAQLQNATQRQALARCGSALVGRGTISTEVLLDPEKPRARSRRGPRLQRNGRRAACRLGPCLLCLATVSFALPFYLRRLRSGAYGFSLQTPVSSALGRWLRLRSFRIRIGRRYRAHGVQRSYLSASCPLPRRFHSLNFPLARATYHFTPGPTISTTILRRCSVRE